MTSATGSSEWASPSDVERVADLLGRTPLGRFSVVRRDRSGVPEVIRNAPLLDDATPMPTRYWLVSRKLQEAVGRLEATGGVRAAEAAVDPATLAAAHEAYARARDAALPQGFAGNRPSGGVGGTRRGVKCLHAHLAYYLAGGNDPVGRFVAGELATTRADETVAVADCGTNSTRLLVVGPYDVPLERHMQITRLGEGLGASGRLSEAAIGRTVGALERYRAIADACGATRVRAVATSAARDAANEKELFDRAEAVFGTRPELLAGEEEGRLAYRGATKDLDQGEGPFVVADVGGGSTELVAGLEGQAALHTSLGAERIVSLPLGCVRITEAFLGEDPPSTDSIGQARHHISSVLEEALRARPHLREPRALVGVAGTSSAIASMRAGLRRHDGSILHLSAVTRHEMEVLLGDLAHEPLAARRRHRGLEPERADVIVGGLLVLVEVMAALGHDALVHSESDILDGLAEELLAGPPPGGRG